MSKTSYAIALGSNRRTRKGSPEATLRAVMRKLDAAAESRVIATPAMGAAGRRFANAAIVVRSKLEPPEMLRRLKTIERKLVIDPQTRAIVLQKKDLQTGETISQLPDETLLKLRAYSRELSERAREAEGAHHQIERTA